ncbi:FG-GAP-like repeat-containing protein [Gimesia aquarii]|uniref:ASPIC and UnbV n=1 Tax=Gimesia aquarii TaxID=2527964 RepID=A0A517W012_9PLAN|nr:FG-GAP-like repeat-containing protein [Gimesia aquarii]QDT98585.1 ASPIC and UnbV [Gimesia aquarii]
MSVSDNDSAPQSRAKRWIAVLGVALLVFVAGGWGALYQFGRSAARAERLMYQAQRDHAMGREQQAERNAAEVLKINPSLDEAAFLAAECAVSQGKFQDALDYLKQLQTSNTEILVRSALFTSELQHYQLSRFSDAERSYRMVLALDSENIQANSNLARLLGLCGRRREAIPHVLYLIRRGVETDLLLLLARESGVINDLEALERARAAVPEDANPLLGLAWHAAEKEQTERAIQLLRAAIERQPDLIAAHVALGRQLLIAERYNELIVWEKQIPPAADEDAETWLVRAQIAEKEGLKEAAIRCYWEAALRAPELKLPNFRLANLLDEIGETQTAKKFAKHTVCLQELNVVQDRFFSTSDNASIEPALELAKSYELTGRIWEAFAWCQLGVRIDPEHQNAQRYLEELRAKIEGIPLSLTVNTANVAQSVDYSMYSLPRFRVIPPSSDKVRLNKPSTMSFRDDAKASSLHFQYFNGTEGRPSRRMFEFTGGGIGVLDFDMDGYPDIYFTQGRPWPPDEHANRDSDRLFRNCEAIRFEDVTTDVGIQESGFGQGVSVGDVNSDGFPDLYVANIGANCLWTNNGDGTFTDVTVEAGVGGSQWTTSCVLADLNADGLTDIYAVNYLTADDVFERICQHPDGSSRACLPFHFQGEIDRLWLNDGNGHFTDMTKGFLSVEPSGKGLGVAVWDEYGSGQLSLLVANDTVPNFFFVNESGSDHQPRLQERGIAAGLALNEDGKAEGCMGISLGDLNDDGQLDVHITNFLSESNTFYVNSSIGYYEDRTRMMDLHSPTLNVLGFGTQFLDLDLDGRLELFVSNGHVDDLRQQGRPYKMLPQLFQWNGQRFSKVDGTALGSYFQEKRLGRSVARIDWNRDGRNDLIVGHLEGGSALLTNTSLPAGNYLSLRLFGVESNRDAIGTTIQVRIDNKTITRQLTAGDGYQASNERRLIVGLGNARQIDELIVRWPSGKVQKFKKVSVSQELWLAEGGKLFSSVSDQSIPSIALD